MAETDDRSQHLHRPGGRNHKESWIFLAVIALSVLIALVLVFALLPTNPQRKFDKAPIPEVAVEPIPNDPHWDPQAGDAAEIDAGLRSGGTYLAKDLVAYHEMLKAFEAGDLKKLGELERADRLQRVRTGTPVLVVDAKSDSLRVDGAPCLEIRLNGQDGNRNKGFVTSHFVAKDGKRPAGTSKWTEGVLRQHRNASFHEAGHAVLAIVLGLELEFVEVDHGVMPDGKMRAGVTRKKPVLLRDIMTKGEEFALPYVTQTLAGWVAERQVNQDADRELGHSEDIREAERLVAMAVCDSIDLGNDNWGISPEEQRLKVTQCKAFFERCRVNASRLVREHWGAIERVAERLEWKKQLTSAEVAALVNDSQP